MLAAALAAACSSPAPGGDDGDDQSGDDAGPDPDGPDGGGDDTPDAEPPDAPRAPAVLEVCATGGAPYTTIADAIADAYSADTIQVCPGTYRERLVISNKAVRLVGEGGAATTILDAESAGVALTVRATGGDGVTVEGFTIRGGSSTTDGGGILCEQSTLTIRATTFTANEAAGGGGLAATTCVVDIDGARFEQNSADRTGGGAVLAATTGTVRNSAFVGNQSVNGAALAVYDGAVTIEANEFRTNVASLRGGAIYANAPVTIAGNQVISNQAGWTGGGLQLHGHAPLVQDNVIQGNTAINDGGGVYAGNSEITMRGNTITGNTSGDSGAGVRISHVPCLVTNNIVRNNESGGTGGGFDLDNDASTLRGGEISGNTAGGAGGGIFAWLGPFNGHTFESVVIKENRAWKGGGIYLEDNFKPVEMRHLTIVDNRAGKGGGLYVRGTNYTLIDSLLAGNRGSRTGGAIMHSIPEPWSRPCGLPDTLPCPPANPTGLVQFVVMHDNESPEGAAIWVDGDHLTVESSILYGHEGIGVAVVPPEPTTDNPTPPATPPEWRYNDTFPASFSGMSNPTGHDGNLSSDPLFTAVEARDYRLSPGSVCIDAGPPGMTDEDGTRADMGLIGGAP